MNHLKQKHTPIKCITMLVLVLALPLLINACAGESSKPPMSNTAHPEKRLVAGELIVNAVKGAEMFGVEMFADAMDRSFYSRALTTAKNTGKMGFPLPRIPQQVRVIWRKSYEPIWADGGRLSFKGELAGDYTIPVASRIPESIFTEIQRNGGALRIKFRLKPDGVMLGWDIQRKGKYALQRFMPGGDFLDTEY